MSLTCVPPGLELRVGDDLVPNLVEIEKLLAGAVKLREGAVSARLHGTTGAGLWLTNSAHSSGLLDLSVVGLEPSSSSLDSASLSTLGQHTAQTPTEKQLTLGTVRLVGRCRAVDELEHERPPGDDTGTTRQEVASDNVLEDRRLSGTLRADDGDLGQVDGRGGETALGERVLQQVDRLDQLRVHLALGATRRAWERVTGRDEVEEEVLEGRGRGWTCPRTEQRLSAAIHCRIPNVIGRRLLLRLLQLACGARRAGRGHAVMRGGGGGNPLVSADLAQEPTATRTHV